MEAINDLTGFERFVQERSRGLWRAAWLLTGDSQHADDLVQTALAKTWGRYDAMENDNQFEAYVRTTIYRTFCSWWRRSSWRNEHPTEILPEQAHTAADQGINMDLRRALDELPRMQRSVIVMQYFEDLPLDQIAERLDIALGTAKAHASRAKVRSGSHPTWRARPPSPPPIPQSSARALSGSVETPKPLESPSPWWRWSRSRFPSACCGRDFVTLSSRSRRPRRRHPRASDGGLGLRSNPR